MREYSLSSLMLTVLVVCLAAARADEPEGDQRTVAIITGIGGKVMIDDKKPDKPVIAIEMFGEQVNDAILNALASWPRYRRLTSKRTLAMRKGSKTCSALLDWSLRRSLPK